MDAVNKASAATGEVKGHYMNVTPATMEEMYQAGPSRQVAGLDHHHDRPCDRLHAIQSMAKWARDNRHDSALAPRGNSTTHVRKITA